MQSIQSRYEPGYRLNSGRQPGDAVKDVAEQAILAADQAFRVAGPDRQQLALQVLADILREHGLVASTLLLDLALEAAVRLTHLLEAEPRP